MSEYDKSDAVKIISIRYEMELRSQKNLFTFAEDVGLETATAVKENGEKLKGVYLEVEPTRVYTTPYHASHLLGTVGRIYADEYEELKGQGYMLDDFVGKDGVEKICEQYLRCLLYTSILNKNFI